MEQWRKKKNTLWKSQGNLIYFMESHGNWKWFEIVIKYVEIDADLLFISLKLMKNIKSWYNWFCTFLLKCVMKFTLIFVDKLFIVQLTICVYMNEFMFFFR